MSGQQSKERCAVRSRSLPVSIRVTALIWEIGSLHFMQSNNHWPNSYLKHGASKQRIHKPGQPRISLGLLGLPAGQP